MDNPSDIGFNSSNLAAHYMHRPRLDKMFDQASRCKLVYVIAGAGYGKTQAVRHYIARQQDAVVRWMQLTESDNIGARYWESLTHIVSIDNPDLADKLRELGFPETLARFKQFAEITRNMEHRSHKTFLVLDDFHLMHSKEVLAFAERCAHLQVPGACVIIISRKEPEINIVSLLSKGDVSIITKDDLRFSTDEAAEFFRLCEIRISSQNLSKLMDATKGWALAVNMLSLMLKRTPNNFKRALAAVRQNISKLLEIEVWVEFPKYVQKAMVRASLLADLPIMPLQEFFGDTEFLKNTSGLSSFIWFDSFTNDFKIHPLYLEFLQSKQHILSYEEKQETYLQAAQWCSENGFYMNAMYYYAKSYQFERMIKAFLSYPFKLPRDTSEYFLNILKNLEPRDGNHSDPNVLFLKNYFIPLLLVGIGRYEEAQELSLKVIREWEHVESPTAIVLLYAAYSNLAYIDIYTCTVTHKYNSPEYLRKSMEHFKRSPIPPAEMTGAFVNADIRSFACLVGEGADLAEFDQFLEAARQTESLIEETPYGIYAGYSDLVTCEYAFFRSQLDLARSSAHNAVLKARDRRQYSIEMLAQKYLLRIAMLEGNAPLVKMILKQLHTHLNNPDFWSRQLYYDLYTGAFYAQIGLPEMVPRWFIMDEKETVSEIHIPSRELIVSGLYYISTRKYQQALTVLCNSYPRDPHERFLFGEMRLLLLTAVARVKTGDTDGAVANFENAYKMSYNGVFEMFFIELGKDLHALVAAAFNHADCDIPEEWLNAIDRKASIYAKKIAVVAGVVKSEMNINESVSLSDREREVLSDLYHGLSREEIAAHRYLSINTVKKTLQSIYIKLDAQNNVDAVRIALEKKFIE
ncbi:MAG: LuxR C-terminal-related transcriptional regulator [Oscillospiraceae bacterium]|nr:LuxR C-terminal-related transcriptional regulator [Oscillospiraceae bacterium]